MHRPPPSSTPQHWQEFEARRLLKKHPLLSQVVVKSSSPDTTRLQTLRPAGTTLASFHGKLWEGFSSGKHEARVQLPIVVEAVAACVVTALQQLGQQVSAWQLRAGVPATSWQRCVRPGFPAAGCVL
jgi:hypothetical protein